MDEMMNMAGARVYVISLRAFSSGRLFGKWMQLSAYRSKEEFMDAFRELYREEKDPTLKILDWQNIPSCLVNERFISDNTFKLVGATRRFSCFENSAFHTWIAYNGLDLSVENIDTLVQEFKVCYQGKFKSRKHFGRYYAEELMAITKSNFPDFDFWSFTIELFKENYILLGNYVFKNLRPVKASCIN